MPRNTCRYRKSKVVFLMMLLATATFLWFSLDATATTRLTISPDLGTVGTKVLVNGAIDTSNGTYVIRWDQTLNITSGLAVEYNVNASFFVPQSVGNSTGRGVFVELIDNTTGSKDTATFKLYTAYSIKAVVPSSPSQLQEGATTDIFVNITGGLANTVYVANVTVENPANAASWSLVSLTNTTVTGYGEGGLQYPVDFGGMRTNYTGTYHVAFNETLVGARAITSLAIGLTNATEYKRFEVVNIRAIDYAAQELVSFSVKTGGRIVFSENASAIGGVVETSWQIPGNAAIGTYTVTVSNSTALGTVKSVADVQAFKIVRALSSLRVRVENATRQPMARVSVGVYNTTLVSSKTTLLNGSVNFSLDVGNYTVKSLIYGLPLNTTSVNITQAFRPNITIVCPTYTLFVRVFDSKNIPSGSVAVSVYEWMSGVTQPVQSGVTDAGGNITFSLTFGRYRLRTYKDSALLNETTIDLIENTNSTIICNLYNVDLSVLVTDYFGQPVPNAIVKLERKVDDNYVEAHSSIATGTDGTAVFSEVIGGDSRISVYVAGKLSQTQFIHLDSSSKSVGFNISGYVVVAGFVLEASQFFTLTVALIIIAIFLIISQYKNVLRFFSRRKKTP